MLRCSLLVIVSLLAISGMAQPPLPEPPPPFIYTPPSQEEQDRSFAKRASLIDELLYPLSYYESADEIFFETSDSVRAARKLRKVYFVIRNSQGESPPVRYYTWYDKMGRPEQTATVSDETGDSLIHRWKYDESRNLKCYITLTYERGAKGAWTYSGDSVLMKYNVNKCVTEISRHSVFLSGKTRTAQFISKTTYTYNSKHVISQRNIDGSKHLYAYDEKDRPVSVSSLYSDGRKFKSDSFAWKSGMFNDTCEHWALRRPGKPMLIDRIVLNTINGKEASYTLYPEEKRNYIREYYGPTHVEFAYDPQGRLVRRAAFTLDGVMKSEFTRTYGADGFITGFQSFYQHDPANDRAPLPPAARNFAGTLFVSVVFNYSTQSGAPLPSEMNYQRTLVGVKSGSRQVLANGMENTPWKIITESYP